MSRATFRIHTTATAQDDVTLPLDLPIYQLLPEICPGATHWTQALFVGVTRRRLSSEQTLTQAGCVMYDDLFLAHPLKPWWEEDLSLSRALLARRHRTRGQAYATIAVLMLMLLAGLALALAWPRLPIEPMTTAARAGTASRPTATLLPVVPTTTLLEAGPSMPGGHALRTIAPPPTATLVPIRPTTPPSPTVEPMVEPTVKHKTAAPAARGPSARSFRALIAASFPEGVRSGRRESCVAGRVAARSGAAIAGAILYANNGHSNTPQAFTDRQGAYQLCGLGDSRWSVVLTYVPGPSKLAAEAVAVVYVSGAPEQRAGVNFYER